MDFPNQRKVVKNWVLKYICGECNVGELTSVHVSSFSVTVILFLILALIIFILMLDSV